LPDSTIIIAKRAIIEKGLLPGIDTSSEDNWWHDIENNWNQVCHGALVSGAITVFDQESELATKVINFATSRMPLALEEYAPDGVYPEGASYWGYGTSYSVLTASLLESALGTDLGISAFKGFKESAVFVLKAIAPSGKYFNFSDCGDEAKIHPYYLMTWFANSTGDCSMMNTEMLMQQSPELPRTCTPVLVWLSSFEEKNSSVIPQNWKGEGKNPVVVFTDTNDYYFACKGGSASLPHANMDAGSFVFETNKIRWSVDPGNQNYNDLEKIGFDLWNKAQDSERWTLLTKNNFGHSTVIINNELQKVKGHSEILSYMDGDTATVSINLTPQFGVNADSVVRTFTKPNNYSLVIEDNIRTNDSTKSISWQMMTTSEVTVEEDGFLLEEKGKQLKIRVLSPSKVKLKVVSLDPPPLQIDKIIPNLKRIEIAIQKPVAMGAIDIIVELENV